MKSLKFTAKNIIAQKLSETGSELFRLLKNKYLYISIITLILGIEMNFYSQEYLLNYIENGSSLPVLSDLILNNIPLWDISYLYDIFSLLSLVVIITYVIHKSEYEKIPYFILLGGIFQIVRGIFIVLTPFGNPEGFEGTDGIFNGFSEIELGVYPSGHTGISFLYFLLVRNRNYKFILLVCVIFIVAALFLSRGHYSIDILSGVFFAYAIKAFGDKHLLNFIVVSQPADPPVLINKEYLVKEKLKA